MIGSKLDPTRRQATQRALTALSFLILSLLAGGIHSVAQAKPQAPALHWTRAANASECVDPRTLAELVEAYTGPVFVPANRAELSLEGRVERAGDGKFLIQVSTTLERGRPLGSRALELQADDCRKLDAAIAFVIATAIDPELGDGTLPAEMSWLQPTEIPAEDALRAELAAAPAATPAASAALAAKESESPPAPGPADRGETTRRAPGETEAHDRWELGLQASVGTETVAGPSAGGVLSVARGLLPWLSLGAQLRSHADLDEAAVDDWHSVNGQTFAVAVLGCVRSDTRASFGAQLCLGPELGWIRVEGDGFEQEHAVVRNSYGGLARLELRYALGASLALSASGLFALGYGRKDVHYGVDQAYPLGGGGDYRAAFEDDPFSAHATLGVVHAF